MESGDFHRYDFGTEGNLEKYGQEQPPQYNVSRVTTPVAIYYSSNDWAVNIDVTLRGFKIIHSMIYQ